MYRVNDIFYSLQGEGHNTGRAAIFIRFAGCNLRCAFCDTEFDSFHEMTADDILAAIADYPARFIVLTGGEPTLQVDEALVEFFQQHGYKVAMESNGTCPAPQNLDWLTISPKGEWNTGKTLHCNELKLVFTEETAAKLDACLPLTFPSVKADYYYLQPCDTGDSQRNALILDSCIRYITEHPHWRLSLQMHKLIGIK